ncbi:L-lactate permease [Amycolatopsis sp. cmx-4-54]|uniref:L-lactate permease n=1 Tax=Amycolatopsis sp. cmx-4-54 TaxID=2790936 RepID=UPI00397E2614
MGWVGIPDGCETAAAAGGHRRVVPLFSAYIGRLGVFLTQQPHVDPILAGATNTSGGVLGKMISPQNLSIGATAIRTVRTGGRAAAADLPVVGPADRRGRLYRVAAGNRAGLHDPEPVRWTRPASVGRKPQAPK